MGEFEEKSIKLGPTDCPSFIFSSYLCSPGILNKITIRCIINVFISKVFQQWFHYVADAMHLTINYSAQCSSPQNHFPHCLLQTSRKAQKQLTNMALYESIKYTDKQKNERLLATLIITTTSVLFNLRCHVCNSFFNGTVFNLRLHTNHHLNINGLNRSITNVGSSVSYLKPVVI